MYLNTGDIKNICSAIRSKSKLGQYKDDKKQLIELLKPVVKNSIFIKEKHWDYENEVRLVTWSNTPNRRICSYGVKNYVEIGIPIECLSKIVLGSLVEIKDVKPALEEIGNELGAEFKIIPSRLPIQ